MCLLPCLGIAACSCTAKTVDGCRQTDSGSLFQILLSIQGMILTSDPYFSEPNVERMRGQSEGTKASSSYNAEIHLNNVRCASSGLLVSLRVQTRASLTAMICAARERLRP